MIKRFLSPIAAVLLVYLAVIGINTLRHYKDSCSIKNTTVTHSVYDQDSGLLTGIKADVDMVESPAIEPVLKDYGALLDHMRSESIGELLKHWTEFDARTGDVRELIMARTAFAEALVSDKEKAARILKDVQELLVDESSPSCVIETLSDSLSDAGTVDAVKCLLNAISNAPTPEAKIAMLTSIRDVGDRGIPGQFRVELSPLLEDAFLKATDKAEIAAEGYALARIGSASVTEMLLLGSYGTRYEANTAHGDVARAVLPHVWNPASVDTFATALDFMPYQSQEAERLALILASMGDQKATQKLLEWADRLPPKASPLLEIVFSTVSDTNSQDLVRKYVETHPLNSDLRAGIKSGIFAATTPIEGQ